MATRAQVPRSKPRFLLTASGGKDVDSTLIPSCYSEQRQVPTLPTRPFTSSGAPGRSKARSLAPARPTTSHADCFGSSEFPRSQSLDRSSPHLYRGRYVQQWVWSAQGRKSDDRKSWISTNKFPTTINPHSVAASSSWTLLRPTVSKSLVQMGVYYTSRL